jgi:hypothetical protein
MSFDLAERLMDRVRSMHASADRFWSKMAQRQQANQRELAGLRLPPRPKSVKEYIPLIRIIS